MEKHLAKCTYFRLESWPKTRAQDIVAHLFVTIDSAATPMTFDLVIGIENCQLK